MGCAVALATTSSAAWAQSNVTFGRITAVNAVTEASRGAQTGGAIIGGTIGAAAGSGRSGSNRALGGIGGAFAGQQIGRLASQSQAFEYTVLIGGSTTRIVSDQAGMRVGDCVAVERGRFNNLRLVDDARCAPRQTQAKAAAKAPPPAVTPAVQREADACVQAKDLLLQAETDEAFDRAYRRVRLLCQDY